MCSYWPDQGISTVNESIQRADRTAELAQKHGGSLQLYWTVGPCDIVCIIEAPDDESATAFLLEATWLGNIQSTTLREYDRDEMSGIKDPAANGRWLPREGGGRGVVAASASL